MEPKSAKKRGAPKRTQPYNIESKVPSTLTEDDFKLVRRCGTIGLPMTHIAYLVGLSPASFKKHITEHPAGRLNQELQLGKASGAKFAFNTAWNEAFIKKNPSMMIFLLKTMYRLNETVEHEVKHDIVVHTQIGPDGTLNKRTMTQEDAMRLIDAAVIVQQVEKENDGHPSRDVEHDEMPENVGNASFAHMPSQAKDRQGIVERRMARRQEEIGKK